MASGDLGTLTAKVTADASNFRRTMSSLGSMAASAAKKVAIIGTAAAGIGSAVAAKLGTESVRAAADFEDAIANAASKVDSTQKTFDRFSQAAIEAGEKSTFSATKAGNALAFLSQAGLDAEKSIQALPGVLQLAEAGQMDLAAASDIATNVLSGMNLEVRELGRVNDVLAKTAATSNTSINELGHAFSLVAPVAAGAGLSVEQTSSALGQFANAGIKASRAGTTLRGMIARLQDQSNKVSNTLEGLGVSAKDSEGNLRNMSAIIGDLSEAGADAEDVMKIFGRRAGPGAQRLLSVGEGALTSYTESLENAGGTAEKQAKFMRKSLGAQLDILQGSFQTLLVTIGEQFAPQIKELANVLTGLTNDLRGSDEMMKQLRATVDAILPMLAGGLRLIGDLGDRISEIMGVLSGQWTTATNTGNAFNDSLDSMASKLEMIPGQSKKITTQVGDLALEEKELKDKLDQTNLSLAKRIELENALQNTELRRKKVMARNLQNQLKGLEKVLPKLRTIEAQRKKISEFEEKSLGGIVKDVGQTRAQMSRKLRRQQQGGASQFEIAQTKRAVKALKVLESHQNSLVNEAGELKDQYGSISDIIGEHGTKAQKLANLQGEIARLTGESAEEMAKVGDNTSAAAVAADNKSGDDKDSAKSITKQRKETQKIVDEVMTNQTFANFARGAKQTEMRGGVSKKRQRELGISGSPKKRQRDAVKSGLQLAGKGRGGVSSLSEIATTGMGAQKEKEDEKFGLQDSLSAADELVGLTGQIGSNLAQATGAGDKVAAGLNAATRSAQSLVGGIQAVTAATGPLATAIAGATAGLSLIATLISGVAQVAQAGGSGGASTGAVSRRNDQKKFAGILADKIVEAQEALGQRQINLSIDARGALDQNTPDNARLIADQIAQDLQARNDILND